MVESVTDARRPLPNEDSSLEAQVQLIMKDWATQMKAMGPDGLWGLNGPQMIFNWSISVEIQEEP